MTVAGSHALEDLALLEGASGRLITDETLRTIMQDAFKAARKVLEVRDSKDRYGPTATTFHGQMERIRNARGVPVNERKSALSLLSVARDVAVLGLEVDVPGTIADITKGEVYTSHESETGLSF